MGCHLGQFRVLVSEMNVGSIEKPTEKAYVLLFFQIFWGLVPGFVRWVLGIVCWVLGIVFWVLGLVFWVLFCMSCLQWFAFRWGRVPKHRTIVSSGTTLAVNLDMRSQIQAGPARVQQGTGNHHAFS